MAKSPPKAVPKPTANDKTQEPDTGNAHPASIGAASRAYAVTELAGPRVAGRRVIRDESGKPQDIILTQAEAQTELNNGTIALKTND